MSFFLMLLLCIILALGGCTRNASHESQAGSSRSASHESQAGNSGSASNASQAGSASNTSHSSRKIKKGTSHSKAYVSPEKTVYQVIAFAKKGQINHHFITVGQTSFATVKENWGKPDRIAKTKKGNFASYSKKDVEVGYKESQSAVFDLRSNSTELQAITLSLIKKVMGKPDQIRYFRDAAVNQEILGYHLNDHYELKWIMNKPEPSNPNPHVDHISIVPYSKVAAIMSKMSLDEKIGQMLLIGMSSQQEADQFIQQEHIGGIILFSRNIKNPGQLKDLINHLKSENDALGNPMPLFISTDQEGGSVQRLPAQIHAIPSNEKIGKKNDPKFSYQIGQVIGDELQSFGFNMDFAPVLGINSHGKNSVIGERSFGSNKKTVSQLGIETMHGIQSKHVISVIKHFPGYGAVQSDAHKVLPTVNETMNQLMNVQWYPYEQAIANGADAIMVTHMVIPTLDSKYPASMSHAVITDMLRKKLGFKGVVCTDDLTMGAIANHYKIGNAAVQSVKAGADIVMVAFMEKQKKAAFQSIKNAVDNGVIPMSRINESVRRIIQLKLKYHLSDQPVKTVNVKGLNQTIDAVLSQK